MWDVIDAIVVFGGLGFLTWFWWTGGRTVLDLSVKRTKEERIRAWFVLLRGAGLAAFIIVLVLLIQHFATGQP
jgi:hypothetical protein